MSTGGLVNEVRLQYVFLIFFLNKSPSASPGSCPPLSASAPTKRVRAPYGPKHSWTFAS